MKAALFYGKEDLRISMIDMPKIADDEILIKIRGSGVCGTDVHIFFGDEGTSDCKRPVVPGHEYAGEVVEVGNKVCGVSIGDRVAVDPNDNCGYCDSCVRGSFNYCENLRDYGATEDGGFAQYGKARAKQVYKLADHISYYEGALAEPVSCCLHGVDLCGNLQGEAVLLIGGGPIGLIMLQLVLNAGAGFVGMITRSREKQEKALALGADYVSAPKDSDAIKKDLRQKGVLRIAAVIECVGSAETFQNAIALADNESTVMMFGLAGSDEVAGIKPFEIFKKELHITSCFMNPGTMGRAVQLINNNRLDLKAVLSPPQPLEKLEDIIRDPSMRLYGKVVIDPWL